MSKKKKRTINFTQGCILCLLLYVLACFVFYYAIGGPTYWSVSFFGKIAGTVGALLVVLLAVLIDKERRHKKSIVLLAIQLLEKYKFLIKQLVSRDFKLKYRRSALGMLWSFFNPLLMMCVQYVVFSTIFKANVENYPVYLLTGIVLFNFFSESSNIVLFAIIGNASLIKKVYVPKYIYPLSKVLSTGVNLLISLLPLLLMAFLTGVRPTRAWLLLPIDLFLLLVFCIGIGLILSSLMVFFRDLQFIWSVLIMAFTYATPVFYPESILPPAMQMTLHFNPMYQYITFFRTVIIQGVSPLPMTYVKCTVIAFVALLIGILVFRKTQDRFIFYI